MKLTVSGDNLAESMGLLSGMVPTPLVHITFGMGYARAVVAATRLGVFDALGRGDSDAATLAEHLDCSPAGMEALLNCLTGFGLLSRREGRYRCTSIATKWVLEDAEKSMKAGVLFLGFCQEMLWGLEDAIRTGEVERLHDKDLSPEFCDAGNPKNIDASAGWNELFFFLISGAKAWPQETLTAWMVEAGFTTPAVKRLMAAPNILLVSERPG